MASARESCGGGCGCLFILVLLGGIGMFFSPDPKANEGACWTTGLGIAGICVAGWIMGSRRCDVCGNPLRRVVHTIRENGRKLRICAHCNQAFERQTSRRATRGRWW